MAPKIPQVKGILGGRKREKELICGRPSFRRRRVGSRNDVGAYEVGKTCERMGNALAFFKEKNKQKNKTWKTREYPPKNTPQLINTDLY